MEHIAHILVFFACAMLEPTHDLTILDPSRVAAPPNGQFCWKAEEFAVTSQRYLKWVALVLKLHVFSFVYKISNKCWNVGVKKRLYIIK